MTTRKPAALKVATALAGLTAVCLTSAASPALAGHGGGGGGGGTGPSTAWVSASPSPAKAWGARVDLAGCGFAFAPAEIRVVRSSGSTSSYTVGMWSTGCLDVAYITTSEPGTYRIEVYQRSGTKKNTSSVLKATTTLSVT